MCCSVSSWALPCNVCSTMYCNSSRSLVLFWKCGLDTIRCTSCQRSSVCRSTIAGVPAMVDLQTDERRSTIAGVGACATLMVVEVSDYQIFRLDEEMLPHTFPE